MWSVVRSEMDELLLKPLLLLLLLLLMKLELEMLGSLDVVLLVAAAAAFSSSARMRSRLASWDARNVWVVGAEISMRGFLGGCFDLRGSGIASS